MANTDSNDSAASGAGPADNRTVDARPADSRAVEAVHAAAPERRSNPPEAPPSFLAHLQSLRELQFNLSETGSDEAILRDGTAGTVEIVGADCAIALVEAVREHAALRCGWNEGRPMAPHETDMFARRFEPEIARLRAGAAPVNGNGNGGGGPAAAAAGSSTAGDGPPAAPPGSGRYGAVLAIHMGSGVGRCGVLVLARHDAIPFTRGEALLAEILASQMAIQIERARRAADARRASETLKHEIEVATRGLQERNRELAALNAVAAAAGPALDHDRQLDAALREAAVATRHAAAAVCLVGGPEGSEQLEFSRGYGDEAFIELARGRNDRAGEGIAGRAWRDDRPVIVPDLWELRDQAEFQALHRAGFRALACVPLHARGRTLGTLLFLADEIRRYTDGEVSLVQALGDQIALVIQNARLFSDIMRYSLDLEGCLGRQTQALDRQQQLMRTLLAVVGAAARSNEVRDLLEGVLTPVLEILGAAAGAVHLLDPASGSLTLRAQQGFPSQALEEIGALRPGRSAIARAFESGEPLGGGGAVVEDVVAGLRLLSAQPLRTLSGVHGVITLAGRERAFDADEMSFLEGIGRLLGIAVENARAFQDGGAAVRAERDLPDKIVEAQKMESIGTLAGGLAHEFNNILGGILGYASHIRALTTADNPIHRHAGTIEEQTQRAAELTRQLLAFARGSACSLERIDLNVVIADTTSFLSKTLTSGVSLEIRLDPDLPAVEADVSQIKQALMNLAVNAFEAMPDGGRIVFETRLAHLDERFVRNAPDLQAGDYVEIVVDDTGVGMPPEVLDRAFEPFFTTKGERRGSGLGLAAVYGIVKNHRGHVALKSTPGLGTTVRIYLPTAGLPPPRQAVAEPAGAAAAPAGAAAAPVVTSPIVEIHHAEPPPLDRRRTDREEPREPEPPSLEPERFLHDRGTGDDYRRSASEPPDAAPPPGVRQDETAPSRDPGKAIGRILVVDDEPTIREMARDILASKGYEVLLAQDGVEALEIYRKNWGRIGLVLLDMIMPRMGGLETFRRLLGMDRTARIVLCSGYSEGDNAQQAVREGALGLLSKPFTLTELLAWVDRAQGRPGPAGRS